jgi:hypothetical protein
MYRCRLKTTSPTFVMSQVNFYCILNSSSFVQVINFSSHTGAHFRRFTHCMNIDSTYDLLLSSTHFIKTGLSSLPWFLTQKLQYLKNVIFSHHQDMSNSYIVRPVGKATRMPSAKGLTGKESLHIVPTSRQT